MTDILQQIEKYSTQCQSYSACTGCSDKPPHPSEFDVCVEDPMSCMERQANGLFRMKEKPLTTRHLSKLKASIRGDMGEKLIDAFGEEGAEEFLSNTEAFCDQPNRSDDAARWCRETLDKLNILFDEDTETKNLNDARNFLKQRDEDIAKIV